MAGGEYVRQPRVRGMAEGLLGLANGINIEVLCEEAALRIEELQQRIPRGKRD